MELNQDNIQKIVAQVLAEMNGKKQAPAASARRAASIGFGEFARRA